MRSMRRPVIAGVLAAAAFGLIQTSSSGSAPREYVVLYEHGASAAQGRDAVEDAGGRIVDVNTKIGVATVRSTNRDFVADAAREDALAGAAPNKPIGHAPRASTWCTSLRIVPRKTKPNRSMRSRPSAASSGAARSKSAQLVVDVRVDFVGPACCDLGLLPFHLGALSQLVGHRRPMFRPLDLGFGLPPKLDSLGPLALEPSLPRLARREKEHR